MDEKKIKELLNDKAFLGELCQIRSTSGVLAAFRERGLELTAEELEDLKRSYMKEILSQAELPEDLLASVSGGKEEEQTGYEDGEGPKS